MKFTNTSLFFTILVSSDARKMLRDSDGVTMSRDYSQQSNALTKPDAIEAVAVGRDYSQDSAARPKPDAIEAVALGRDYSQQSNARPKPDASEILSVN